MKKKFRYLYGPVSSWRLGRSLGVDLLSRSEKICTFDCVYCQLGATVAFSGKRQVFVPTESVIKEIKSLPAVKLDSITFSGRGEPTLARNLGQVIRAVRKFRKEKIAVITNASLINREDVRRDLALADFVLAKMDATSSLVGAVNRPMRGFRFEKMLKGLQTFRKVYRGRLALQAMFINANGAHAREIAHLVANMDADEIHINTPLRPCGVKPLGRRDLEEIRRIFTDVCGERVLISTVYEAERKKTMPFGKIETLLRRGAVR